MTRKNIHNYWSSGKGFSQFQHLFQGQGRVSMWLHLQQLRFRISTAESILPNWQESLYPEGIPIYAEEQLPRLIRELKVKTCVFSYSDLPYQKVMTISAIVNAAGANFALLGTNDTMIKSTKPVIAVCAVRTGCGKSQTSRQGHRDSDGEGPESRGHQAPHALW